MANDVKVIGLDFETFYSTADGYTLRKMTLEEYIRDARFEVIMMATYDAMANEGAGLQRYEHIPKELNDWLYSIDWDNTVIVSWNAHFDGAILAWVYGIRPRAVICAMAMWRTLGLGVFGGESLDAATKKGVEWGWTGVQPKGDEVGNADGKRWIDFTHEGIKAYGQYCMTDAANAFWLYQNMISQLNFPHSEVLTISDVVKCFTTPRLRLNHDKLSRVLAGQILRQEDAMKRVGVQDKRELRSDEMFATFLRSAGVDPIPTKLNAKGQERYAFAKTDQGMQEILEGPNEIAADLVEARLMTKSSITESRSRRMVDIASRGAWPVFLKPAAAHTLRLGGGDKVNPQNFSKRDGTREGIEAAEGYTLLDPDSSQIEARFAGYLCDQDDLVEDFRRKTDVYCKFGNHSSVFPFEVTKATPDARFLCKTVVLGGGFGAAAQTMQTSARNIAFSLNLGPEIMQLIETADWQGLNTAYRNQNFKIRGTWNRLTSMLRQLMQMEQGDGELTWGPLIRMSVDWLGPGLTLPNGLRIYYHNLRVDPETDDILYDKVRGRRLVPNRIYGAKVLENFDQAVSGLTIREQWLEITRRAKREFNYKHSPVVLQVHDALTAVVKDGMADDFGRMMVEVMRTPPVWAPTIPLDAELKAGKNYGELREVKV